MTRILISALAAVLIHGAVLVFLPFPATPPGAISPHDHGINVQITHLSPEPKPKAEPAPAPDMPPVPRPEEKQPPEPVPDIETPPPPSTQIEAEPDPAEITVKKELMPKKEDLTLSPPQPEAQAPEPDVPNPVSPDPKTSDKAASDNTGLQSRKIPDPDLSETRPADGPSTGITASTAVNPDAIAPDAPPVEKKPCRSTKKIHRQNIPETPGAGGIPVPSCSWCLSAKRVRPGRYEFLNPADMPAWTGRLKKRLPPGGLNREHQTGFPQACG